MKNITIDSKQAERVIWKFLEGLLDTCPYRFLNDGQGYMMLEYFIHELTPFDWLNAYSTTCLKPIPFESQVTTEELFQSIITLVCEYCYFEEYRIFELIPLLHGMRNRPDEYKKEWDVWNQAVQEAINLN